MLSADRLTLAIDIHSQSYQLLRWIGNAMAKGFIPVTRVHQPTNVCDAAITWIEDHYLNLPQDVRPDRRHLREFANFFATYVTSTFDIIEQPGTRLVSRCGCYCPLCAHIVNAPHLQPKRLTKRDKDRAKELMVDRVTALAAEEGVGATAQTVTNVVRSDDTRRAAAYSTYGYWLIRRLEGDTDGKSVLALWREIAWNRSGSPIKKFKLRYKDFVEAEDSLVDALRTTMVHGSIPG